MIPQSRRMFLATCAGAALAYAKREPSVDLRITLDFEGRLLAWNAGTGAIVRREHNGLLTPVAQFHTPPADILVHPDRAIWVALPNGIVRLASEPELVSNVPARAICFSADYRRIYIAGESTILVARLTRKARLGSRRLLAPITANALRCDSNGNIWCACESGVQVFSAQGYRIRHLPTELPCTNLRFTGPRRNRLLVTAGGSIYSLCVETHGAHIA